MEPPRYGVSRSAVPWKAILGVGRDSAHGSHASISAVDTVPTAAIRSGSAQESASAIAPPFESPSA